MSLSYKSKHLETELLSAFSIADNILDQLEFERKFKA
jgi:hypothetical protein